MCIRDSGNTGRNTTIIRSNYLTPEGVRFYDRSVALWKGLNDELGINLFYSCLLYTSDAADERSSVDLGGRRIIKKKKTNTNWD